MSRQIETPVGGVALATLAALAVARNRPFPFRAMGGSMSPFVREGDLLTLAKMDAPLQQGMVVAFRYPESGRMIVHRVVSVSGNRFLARGDSMPAADGWFSSETVIGAVAAIERSGKPVHLGLGMERVLIAALSRSGMLRPILWLPRKLYRLFIP